MIGEKIYETDNCNCSRAHKASHNSEILEGISEAQWEAFTIEEQFSKCQLSPSATSHSSYPVITTTVPIQAQCDIKMAEQKSRTTGKLSGLVLDIERILDKELIRIFMTYEARKTPWGLLIDGRHLDFCVQFIGRRLKTDKVKVSGESKEASCGQNENSAAEGETHTEGNSMAEAPHECVDTPKYVMDNEGRDKAEETCTKKDNRNEEIWSFLWSIMQMDGPRLSPQLVPLGHGAGRRLKSDHP